MVYGFQYDGAGTRCSGIAQPGAKALANWAKAKWDLPLIGIYNCRASRAGTTLSLHGEGRAIDLHVHVGASEALGTSEQTYLGSDIASWMVRHADVLGVQRVIWLQ